MYPNVRCTAYTSKTRKTIQYTGTTFSRTIKMHTISQQITLITQPLAIIGTTIMVQTTIQME